MNERTVKVIIGAVAAAAAAVVTYLFGQGIITLELATALNGLIAFVAGYVTPKSLPA